ncbi:Uncharacterized conserved protein, DUF2141 family [Duganella sp. CF402]|uniref:DUF2141 domain-containing protein n=1 Tax=unclassified Duganella TaxID=2636909 RepID=UPI0008B13FF9|nr:MULTISPECIES: DUF2141 domain-containing protein [unclassified Duganella]RZT10379.1 uncharacterized protein (DUF2141 family) [Duganella sp. BK701]SEL15672.1 Uncharacterized conserved protein, DUF2141 family [Duganella sp. CF402]
MSRLMFASSFALLFAAAAPSFAAELTISIEGVASADGQVMVAIFNSADTFLAKPLRGAAAPAHEGTVQVQVADLPAGDYAFAVYHDANGNGKLDRNSVGMPTEDYAFSNNAFGKRGAPSFQDARIALPADGATIRVSLR